MIEAKHTPGPWKAKQVRTSGDYRIRAENGEEIADVFEDAYDGTAESNARLIAAAPEMHALLLQIHGELSHAASPDADPANWEGYTLHRIEQLLWPENTGSNHETGRL